MLPRLPRFPIALALLGMGAFLLGSGAQAQDRTCGDDSRRGDAATGVLIERPAAGLNPARVIEPLSPRALRFAQRRIKASFPPEILNVV